VRPLPQCGARAVTLPPGKDIVVARQRPASALRPLYSQVYLPNFLFATGQGAILPMLAIAARHVGASATSAGLVVATNGIATLLFDVPAGRLVGALGESRAGLAACVALVVGLSGALFATSTLELAIGVAIASCGSALWMLVRLTHLSRVAPPVARGRALSLLGGVTRAGYVLGPLLVVALASASDPSRAFLIDIVAVASGFAVLAASRDRHDGDAHRVEAHMRARFVPARGARLDLATAGVGTFAISLLRASRVLLIPLWGVHIGLPLRTVSLVYALSSLVDLTLFYPAGWLSDRHGRKAVVIPSLVLMSFGNLCLPISHSLSVYIAAAILTGVGNGLGAGIVMTLGADRAPPVGRASFLAVWRLVADLGTTTGPLLASATIAALSLSAAPLPVAVVGLGAAATVGAFMRGEAGAHPATPDDRTETGAGRRATDADDSSPAP